MATTNPGPDNEERRRLIGRRIRATRMAADIGLRQMARDLGMSPSWVLSVESGNLSIDALRLMSIADYLGYPVGYFLEETDHVKERERQLMSRPATRLDWQVMYEGDEDRARAHFEIDRVFRRMEEERQRASE